MYLAIGAGSIPVLFLINDDDILDGGAESKKIISTLGHSEPSYSATQLRRKVYR